MQQAEDKLKLLYPSIDESKLQIIIFNAEQFFCEYCHIPQVPTAAQDVIAAMAMEDINKLGAEGLASESVAGQAVSYLPDYSPKIYKRLKAYKKIRVV